MSLFFFFLLVDFSFFFSLNHLSFLAANVSDQLLFIYVSSKLQISCNFTFLSVQFSIFSFVIMMCICSLCLWVGAKTTWFGLVKHCGFGLIPVLSQQIKLDISVSCHKKHGSKLSEVSFEISIGVILIMLKHPGPTSKVSSLFRLTNAQMQTRWIGGCVACNSNLFKDLDLTVDYIQSPFLFIFYTFKI